MVYLDYNATAPLLPEARTAWVTAADLYLGNPSSPHRLGSRAEKALDDARSQLGAMLGADSSDLIWTSGATESSNAVLRHAGETLPVGAEVWASAIEHPCVLAAVRRHFPERHRLIPCDTSGVTDLNWLSTALTETRPGLVIVMAANNETGVLQPWQEALRLCHDHDVRFYCDATQWIGKVSADDLGGCDFLSGSAHKLGGPRGVGFLKVPSQSEFSPLLVGGPQEGGRRAGTENVAGVLSMMAALEVRQAFVEKGDHQAREVQRDIFERSLAETLPGVTIVGAGQARLWNTVSVLMPETGDGRRWVVKLDKAGYAVSTGSACSSGKEMPSHVLSAMGYPPESAARALRFSGGWETPAGVWDRLLQTLARISHREIQAKSRTALEARKCCG